MMDPRQRLTTNLIAESQAYGYTLTVWGTGAMLVHRAGMPDLVQVLLFGCGALVGFAGLGAFAFQRWVTDAETEGRQHLVVASTVHIVATLGSLLLSYLAVQFVVVNAVPDWLAFLLAGFQATVSYNVLLLLEDFVSERFVEVAPFVDDV